MAIIDCFCHPTPVFLWKSDNAFVANPTVSSKIQIYAAKKVNIASTKPSLTCSYQNSKALAVLMGAAGITLVSLVGPSHASESPIFSEPSNALSIPTWTTHISSVVEWVTAMALVWQYGEKSGYESWKGLSWGMVPLLGGALCACTWHFFYNSESLEVLVAIQAALTVIGNLTMCIAAYRIYMSSHKDF